MTYNNSSYGQSIISGDDTDYIFVQEKIQSRKLPPTTGQIKALKRYLKDFKIKVSIPQFDTVAEMESWKIKQVKVRLER